MQLRKAINDELMLPASLNLDPVFLVRLDLSLPAKSTNESWLTWTGDFVF